MTIIHRRVKSEHFRMSQSRNSGPEWAERWRGHTNMYTCESRCDELTMSLYDYFKKRNRDTLYTACTDDNDLVNNNNLTQLVQFSVT